MRKINFGTIITVSQKENKFNFIIVETIIGISDDDDYDYD